MESPSPDQRASPKCVREVSAPMRSRRKSLELSAPQLRTSPEAMRPPTPASFAKSSAEINRPSVMSSCLTRQQLWWLLAELTTWPRRFRWRRSPSTPGQQRRNWKQWCASRMRVTDSAPCHPRSGYCDARGVLRFCLLLQPLDLFLMVGAVAGHPLDHLRDGNISVQLGVECRFLKICQLQASQQLHIGMTIQPIERNQFRRRSLHVAETTRPIVLIDGRNHRLLIGEHLPHAIRINDFGIRQVRQNFMDAPLVRRRFVAQRLVRKARHGRRNLLRTLLSRIEMLLQFGFSHEAPRRMQKSEVRILTEDRLPQISAF